MTEAATSWDRATDEQRSEVLEHEHVREERELALLRQYQSGRLHRDDYILAMEALAKRATHANAF